MLCSFQGSGWISIQQVVTLAQNNLQEAVIHIKLEKSFGGGKRTRTADILLAKQALYQLSYTPKRERVGHPGLEPGTSPLSGVRSNHLS